MAINEYFPMSWTGTSSLLLVSLFVSSSYFTLIISIFHFYVFAHIFLSLLFIYHPFFTLYSPYFHPIFTIYSPFFFTGRWSSKAIKIGADQLIFSTIYTLVFFMSIGCMGGATDKVRGVLCYVTTYCSGLN